MRLFGCERRMVSPESTAINVERQKVQPIPQLKNRNKLIARQKWLDAEALHSKANPPQAHHIEAGDNKTSVRNQNAVNLAKQCMRIIHGFERMRHHNQIDRFRFKRKVFKTDLNSGALSVGNIGERCQMFVGINLCADSVAPQEIDACTAELQRIVAETVRHELVILLLFPIERIAA